ncbi:hypothetical protein [Halorubrum californiense]|nr:hypothetical protein [Halorubrum californiense]
MTSVKTVAGAVRFLVLFMVYVAALTAMGVLRAARASSRWVVGLFSAPEPEPAPGERRT